MNTRINTCLSKHGHKKFHGRYARASMHLEICSNEHEQWDEFENMLEQAWKVNFEDMLKQA